MPCNRRMLQMISSSMMLLCHAPQQKSARAPSISGCESGPMMDVNLFSCAGPIRRCSREGSVWGSGELKADWREARQECSVAGADGPGTRAGAGVSTVFELKGWGVGG